MRTRTQSTLCLQRPDDQKFIDLAVAHQAVLYSKDKYVLALKNRLARLGIDVRQRHPA